jgi:hypothetical protein
MTADANSCARLDRLLRRVRFQVQVRHEVRAGRQCTLELQPQYVVDLAAQDRALMRAARQNLAHYGLKIHDAECKPYAAAIGAEPYPFRLCPVTVGN